MIAAGGNYVHGWSPNGKWLVFSANRGQGFDLLCDLPGWEIRAQVDLEPPGGRRGQVIRLTGWIYFLSDRGGTRDIRRIPAAGTGQGDIEAQQITSDDREDAALELFARRQVAGLFGYIPLRTNFNAIDRDLLIRRLPLTGGRSGRKKPTDMAPVVGGHGSLGARPFSPDGKRLVYAA